MGAFDTPPFKNFSLKNIEVLIPFMTHVLNKGYVAYLIAVENSKLTLKLSDVMVVVLDYHDGDCGAAIQDLENLGKLYFDTQGAAMLFEPKREYLQPRRSVLLKPD